MQIRSRRAKATFTSILAFALAIPLSALALSAAAEGPGILLFGLPLMAASMVTYWSWAVR